MSNNPSLHTFIELHLIQNFSPSNLNRDDTGSPKDCEFGGHRRARISSQSLKRAIRNHPRFAKMTAVDNGKRSKWLTRQIIKALVASGQVEEDNIENAQNIATEFIKRYDGKIDSKTGKTSVLIFFSKGEENDIVSTFVDNWEDIMANNKTGQTALDELAKRIKKSTEKRTDAPDIALFGRMLAGKVEFNVDAACQVSHAISTHRATMEMDYYTAVDELLQDDESGAGMVGFTGFNSACFYRYCRIDWGQLVKNLDDDTELAERTVAAFLRAALDAIPTGKQNAFAAQNPTSLALVVLRHDGMSWNLANAFESPVRPQKESQKDYSGYVAPSIAALEKLWNALTEFYDDAEIAAVSVYTPEEYRANLGQLSDHLKTTVSTWMEPIKAALTEV